MPTPPNEPLQIVSPEPNWHLLDRYFSGECTAAEAESITRWAADESNAQLLAQVREIWVDAAVVRLATDEDAAWRALGERIAVTSPRAGNSWNDRPILKLLPLRPSWVRRSLQAAAALIALAGAGLWWQWQKHEGVAVARAERPVREYATRRGQRAELMLLDGTRVWLSAESRLRVSTTYGAGVRDVQLEGEAYFAVRHDSSRPFRVHTPGAVSEDLGTEFSVRAYADDSDATVVVVASGRVVLRPEGAKRATGSVELAARQMGRLDRSGMLHRIENVELTRTLGWREGWLEFDEQPLAAVVRELERWYDIDIVLDDPALAQVPVTASIRNQTVDQALGVIAAALDARYAREDRQARFITRARGR